jgi:hypothetical protein
VYRAGKACRLGAFPGSPQAPAAEIPRPQKKFFEVEYIGGKCECIGLVCSLLTLLCCLLLEPRGG